MKTLKNRKIFKKAKQNNKNSNSNSKKNTFKKQLSNTFLHNLKGGKYVDEGGFGCVITPAIPCSRNDKNLEKSISKISRDDVTNEIKISNILSKLDPSKKYYITYDKYCYLNNIPDNRDDLVSVHYTDDKLTNFKIDKGQEKKDKKACYVELALKPINLIMDHGGYSLSSIMKTNRKSKGTRALMHQMFIDNLRPYLKHLILGVIKMHNNRIVNRDIKQKNIMMNWNKETNEVALRYIDFGLSEFLTTEFCRHISNINRHGTQFYISPEVHIAYILRSYSSRSEHYIMKKIMNELHDNVKRAFLKINEQELFGNLDNNIKILYEKIKYLYDNNKILTSHFGTEKNKFNGYIQKCDVYALGISIFETLYVYSEINVRHNSKLYDLLIHMIAFDPDKRYNAVQCLSHPYFQVGE
jgi:serine/threonine protein kinase